MVVMVVGRRVMEVMVEAGVMEMGATAAAAPPHAITSVVVRLRAEPCAFADLSST